MYKTIFNSSIRLLKFHRKNHITTEICYMMENCPSSKMPQNIIQRDLVFLLLIWFYNLQKSLKLINWRRIYVFQNGTESIQKKRQRYIMYYMWPPPPKKKFISKKCQNIDGSLENLNYAGVKCVWIFLA